MSGVYARSWHQLPRQIFPLSFLSPNQPDSNCRSSVRSPRTGCGINCILDRLCNPIFLGRASIHQFLSTHLLPVPLHECCKTHPTKRSHCACSGGPQVFTESPAHDTVSRGAQQDRSVPAHQALLNLPIPTLRETPKHQRRTTVDRRTTCQAQEPDRD